MHISSGASREVLIEELDLHKAEFSALREEILHWLDAQRQYLNLSLAAIAAGLGVAPFISQQKTFSIFLLFPLVFHVLLWEMLNSVRIIGHLSSYLVDTLIPRVNAILDKLGDDRDGTMALGWEVRVATRPVSPSDLVLASLAPTLHWVPILAIGALMVSYAVLINSSGYSPPVGEILLIIVNLVFLILAAIRNVIVVNVSMRQARRLRKEKVDDSERKPESQQKRTTREELTRKLKPRK